jgi:hypothetical protein
MPQMTQTALLRVVSNDHQLPLSTDFTKDRSQRTTETPVSLSVN